MKIFLFYFIGNKKLQGRRKNSESVGLVETELLFIYALASNVHLIWMHIFLLQPRYSCKPHECYKQLFESNIIDLPSLPLMSAKFLNVSVRVCDTRENGNAISEII